MHCTRQGVKAGWLLTNRLIDAARSGAPEVCVVLGMRCVPIYNVAVDHGG